MSLKKKVYWVAHEGEKSGANNALLAFTGALKDQYDITVIVPSKGTMWQECEKMGVEVKILHYYSVIYSRNGRINLQWIRKRLRNTVTFIQAFFFFLQEKPKLVITNSIVSPPFFGMLAFLLRIKHVWYLQEFGNKDHGIKFDWGYTFTLKYINFLSNRVIVVSDAIKQHIKHEINEKKIDVIFNCVEVPEVYWGKGPSKRELPFRILHIAQIATGKNQLEGIIALKILLKKGINAVLEIAGAVLDSAYKSKLEQYVVSEKMENNVFFSGFTSTPFEKISNAHVVLLCSRSEACALTIFETLRIGTPIILSNTGGNGEIVNHLQTGLIYEYGDTDDLADKISLLYMDESLSETISKNAQIYSLENYRLSRSVQKIIDVIEATLL